MAKRRTQRVSTNGASQALVLRTMPAQVQVVGARRRQRRRRNNSPGARIQSSTVPAAFTTAMTQSTAKITPIERGIRIAHRELTFSMPNDSNKSVRKTQICPARLPWLGGISRNYSRYRFREVKAFWVSNVGSNHAGTISYGFAYDALDKTSTLTDLTVADVSAIDASVSQNIHTLTARPAVADCSPGRSTQNWYPYATPTQVDALEPGEDNDYIQSYLYTIVEQSPASGTGGIAGYMHLSYVVDLIDALPLRINDPTVSLLMNEARVKNGAISWPAIRQPADMDLVEHQRPASHSVLASADSPSDNLLLYQMMQALTVLASAVKTGGGDDPSVRVDIETESEVRVINTLLDPVPTVLLPVPAEAEPAPEVSEEDPSTAETESSGSATRQRSDTAGGGTGKNS